MGPAPQRDRAEPGIPPPRERVCLQNFYGFPHVRCMPTPSGDIFISKSKTQSQSGGWLEARSGSGESKPGLCWRLLILSEGLFPSLPQQLRVSTALMTTAHPRGWLADICSTCPQGPTLWARERRLVLALPGQPRGCSEEAAAARTHTTLIPNPVPGSAEGGVENKWKFPGAAGEQVQFSGSSPCGWGTSAFEPWGCYRSSDSQTF